jgi:hypothetical protein
LKRAADLAEALYSMPRNNQLGLGAPRSPPGGGMPGGFNSYAGQLAVSVQDTAAAQWTDGEDVWIVLTTLTWLPHCIWAAELKRCSL